MLKRMFIEYTETLDKLEQVLKKTGVKYLMVPFNERMNTNSSHFKFDYKLNCKGGEQENDWWTCSGGFYFTDLKTGHEYEMIAPDKRAIKEIKKGIKQSK